MSDRGRYDYDITTGNRSYGGESRGHSRNSDSIFGGGGGGWGGRPQDRGDDDRQQGGGWTSERENFGSGRDRHRGGGNRDREGGRDWGGGHGQGERMSSGWGGLEHLGEGRREHGREGGRGRERGQERERNFGPDDRRDGLPIDETSRLIASNKVEGTAVYGREGERLGSIYNFMVDKRSGQVEYAVMSYGGMLGMGQRYYPLPWRMLTYDTREGGYHINMSERDLRNAPSFDRSSEPRFDRNLDERVHGWYGTNR